MTNASLTSQLNDLKSQHAATEVTTIDNKTKKNASDILALENKLQQILKNDKKMYVYLQGTHFKQKNVLTSKNDHVINNNVINIYIAYKLDPIASTRDDTFTVQNALFGAMQITKNFDTSKYAYKGYGMCFDEGGMFSAGSINNRRNVLIFGVHENYVFPSSNKANNIYVMGKDIVQGINDAILYAGKIYIVKI